MPGWVGWGGGEGTGYQGVGGPVLDPVLELEFELELEFPDPADRLDCMPRPLKLMIRHRINHTRKDTALE